jgi:HAD superfamily hydrolase (TIGR01490 family)
MMKLALFDLDNTLLPLDSDHGWSQFLIEKGQLNGLDFEIRNHKFYADYKAGTLNIQEFLDFQLRPLRDNTYAQLVIWLDEFMAQVIAPNIKASARELVAKHQAQNDVCIMITATNRFITQPIAHAFGIEALIATEPEIVNGQYTGKVNGLPSFREGKVTRLNQWLAKKGWNIGSFENSYFYSDSFNDLPLLEYVTHPVATNPDQHLTEIAHSRGWPVIELFK